MTDPAPVLEITPEPLIPPKPKISLLPLFLGFLIVIICSAVIALAYYKIKLASTPLPPPTPAPSALASVQPSLEPSATPSSTPKASKKPNPADPAKRDDSRATPTPVPLPTLDIRFGNPSVNVKQTIDEGKGDGRVINREYTSIQAGQFDEVSSTWSPRVTVCYHLVSNEAIVGKNIKFSFSLDDKIELEDNMSWIDQLEAGKIYDWCHDVTTSIGKHTAKLLLNPDKSVKEYNYVNDLARLDWENLTDKISPNYTLTGPSNEGSDGTCFIASYISDNVTSVASLKYEIKQDGGSWQTTQSDKYCLRGDSGSSHSLSFRITDARGNANEQSKSFVLY